jgi:hypothetical protein
MTFCERALNRLNSSNSSKMRNCSPSRFNTPIRHPILVPSTKRMSQQRWRSASRPAALRCILVALGFGCLVVSYRSLAASLAPGTDGDSLATTWLTSTMSPIDEILSSPTSLRRSIQVYLQKEQSERFTQLGSHPTSPSSSSFTYYDTVLPFENVPPSIHFWNVIENYAIPNATTMHPSFHTACTDPPGAGWEGSPNAHRLLTKKIQLFTPAASSIHRPNIRLLCALYTHPPMHALARMAALTWGVDCDGFVAFSSSGADPALGVVDLPQRVGPESYGNMWQKTRAIWKYIYTTRSYHEYDYIHLSGDDVYILVPNLKHFLQQEGGNSLTPVSVFAGQWIRQRHRPYVGGGPGYTLSRRALHQYMQTWDTCYPNITSSAEDRYMSLCMKAAQVPLTDTRDVSTGEQTYHDCPPQQVYESSASSRRRNFHNRAVAYWETLPHPGSGHNITEPWRPVPLNTATMEGNTTPRPVGPKHGFEAAAQYSIAFHKIHHPLFMLRMHTLLHPNLCSL